MKSAEIREAFLSYFADQGHTTVPSSSLVPGNITYGQHEMSKYCLIFWGSIYQTGNRFAGNNQQMGGRLGCNIAYRNAVFIFINDVCWYFTIDNSGKQGFF